ncbi:MAG TPA: hypothetical protein VGN54_01240 [Mycobacteriales bacterium]|jgi:hypothetical protein|nr:hypothetical protein [Mycobacteriales bacterium]
MGFLDNLLGRTKPVQANLDALFGVPSAAITLQSTLGLLPTGVGAVSVKVTEGSGYAAALEQALALLRSGGTQVTQNTDTFGFTWLTVRADPAALPELITNLHGANTAFNSAGLGPALLCTTVGFTGADGTVGLVYLFKRGTFYPFAPTGPEQRDNAFELAVRAALGDELPVEADLTRWFPVWGTPLS